MESDPPPTHTQYNPFRRLKGSLHATSGLQSSATKEWGVMPPSPTKQRSFLCLDDIEGKKRQGG